MKNLEHIKSWKFIQNRNNTKEKLNEIALYGANKNWTYSKMFSEWESYAKMFTGLGITKKNNSKVIFYSGQVPEEVIIEYALDMTGAVVYYMYSPITVSFKQIKKFIKEEGITDIIFYNKFFFQDDKKYIAEMKDNGIKNILLFDTDLPNELFNVCEKTICNVLSLLNYKPGAVLIDNIIEKYKDVDIYYDNVEDDVSFSFCTFTSGTTGEMKPVRFSDRSRNAMAMNFINNDFEKMLSGKRTLPFVPVMAAYGLINSEFVSLVLGAHITYAYMLYGQIKKFNKLVMHNKPEVIYANTYFFNALMKNKSMDRIDLSYISLIAIGGSKTSNEKLEKIKDF